MARYKVMTRKAATSSAILALDRALDRAGVGESGPLLGAKIMDSGGRLQILLDIPGPPSHRRSEGMNAFASVWYDAFGERGAGLLGFLIEKQVDAGGVGAEEAREAGGFATMIRNTSPTSTTGSFAYPPARTKPGRRSAA